MSTRLAQSAERKALNLVVVGSSPTVGAFANCEGLGPQELKGFGGLGAWSQLQFTCPTFARGPSEAHASFQGPGSSASPEPA